VNNQTILLVEDNDDDAELTIKAFEQVDPGRLIARAADGVDALDYLLRRGRHVGLAALALPAVVLLDLKLPRKNGIEVLTAIRAEASTRHLPVVVLTSSAEDKDRLAAYDQHANSYVRKPVDYEQFVAAARQLARYWMVLNLGLPRAS